jgi:hypothetical protein
MGTTGHRSGYEAAIGEKDRGAMRLAFDLLDSSDMAAHADPMVPALRNGQLLA